MKLRGFILAAMLCMLCVGQASALECVGASSISLALPQTAGLAHSAAPPFPTKSYDFAGALYDAPDDYLFAAPTSDDTIYEWEDPNVDRSKNTALIPPTFGSPTSYLPGSGRPLTPNLVPGALDGGLVTQVGSVNYPTLDSSEVNNWNDFSQSAPSNLGFTKVTSNLYYSGGYLGTLQIPAIGLSVKVYEGTDSGTLAKGAGHFQDTSIWDGNVSIAGHNRGVRDDFGDLHTLEPGDTVTWTTKLGTRTYEVVSVDKVLETDTSGTAATTDNRLTLFTCVMNERAYRWQVQAAEV